MEGKRGGVCGLGRVSDRGTLKTFMKDERERGGESPIIALPRSPLSLANRECLSFGHQLFSLIQSPRLIRKTLEHLPGFICIV